MLKLNKLSGRINLEYAIKYYTNLKIDEPNHRK